MANDWKPRAKFVDPTRLTRKVFDKHVDRMEQHRARDRQDHRNDLKAIFQRMQNLEDQLTLLAEHQLDHCHDLDLLADKVGVPRKSGREEL